VAGYKPANEDRGRRGQKFLPSAEELVYMLDYQSSNTMKTQVESACEFIKFNSQER
jgi:hypothetical protein